jgi:hypothetical protein
VHIFANIPSGKIAKNKSEVRVGNKIFSYNIESTFGVNLMLRGVPLYVMFI